MDQLLIDAFFEASILTLRDAPNNTELIDAVPLGKYLGTVRDYFSDFGIAIMTHDEDDLVDGIYWMKPITAEIICRTTEHSTEVRSYTVEPITKVESEDKILRTGELILFGHSLMSSQLSGLKTWTVPLNVRRNRGKVFTYYTCGKIPELSEDELLNIFIGDTIEKPLFPDVVPPNIGVPVDDRIYGIRDVTDWAEGIVTYGLQFNDSVGGPIAVNRLYPHVEVCADTLQKNINYDLQPDNAMLELPSLTLPTTMKPTTQNLFYELLVASSADTIYSILMCYQKIWMSGKLTLSHRIIDFDKSTEVQVKLLTILLSDPQRLCEVNNQIIKIQNSAMVTLIERDERGSLTHPSKGVLDETVFYGADLTNIPFDIALIRSIVDYDDGDSIPMSALICNIINFYGYRMQSITESATKLATRISKYEENQMVHPLASLLIAVCLEW
jgi:hypothetical protein